MVSFERPNEYHVIKDIFDNVNIDNFSFVNWNEYRRLVVLQIKKYSALTWIKKKRTSLINTK